MRAGVFTEELEFALNKLIRCCTLAAGLAADPVQRSALHACSGACHSFLATHAFSRQRRPCTTLCHCCTPGKALAEGAVSGCVRASSMHHGTAQLYDAMYAYFSRDSVAMPGFAHFFQARPCRKRLLEGHARRAHVGRHSSFAGVVGKQAAAKLYTHNPKAQQERVHPQPCCPWRQVLSMAERADGRTVMDQINKVAHILRLRAVDDCNKLLALPVWPPGQCMWATLERGACIGVASLSFTSSLYVVLQSTLQQPSTCLT